MPQEKSNKYVEEYIDGNEDVFTLLVQENISHVYSFILRIVKDKDEADALTQDTFVKVWRNIKKFDTSKNFKVWIFTIAKNVCFDWFRKRKNTLFSELASSNTEDDSKDFDVADDKTPDIVGDLDDRESLEKLRKEVENLQESYRVVVYLRHNEDLSFQQIAEVLDEPINTVKSRYRRAGEILRKKLKSAMHQN